MARWLRALATVAEDLSLIANTHMGGSQLSVTAVLEDLTHTLLTLEDARHVCVTHTYMWPEYLYI